MPNNVLNIFPPHSGRKQFNIIFTMASIPPVLAAVLSINSKNETYAIIQRGRTYSGIEKIENFHNMGFNPEINSTAKFSQEHISLIVAKIKELCAENPGAYFNIFVQDATPILGVAVAANAGLAADDFHIYMIEDGVMIYKQLAAFFENTDYSHIIPIFLNNRIKNISLAKKLTHLLQKQTLYNVIYSVTKRVYFSNLVASFVHNIFFPVKKLPALRYKYIYTRYVNDVAAAKKLFESLMARNDVNISEPCFSFGLIFPFSLAALDNFSLIVQDSASVQRIVSQFKNAEMITAFSDTSDKDIHHTAPKIHYIKIFDAISALSSTDKSKYLSLVFGDSFDEIHSMLTRKFRADMPAPERKLLFFKQMIFVQDYFITLDKTDNLGFNDTEYIPVPYEKLDKKLRNGVIFSSEADYRILSDILSDRSNYPDDFPDTELVALQRKIFTSYINYIFQLKITYKKFGAAYDFIIKGHPSAPLGHPEEWPKFYYNYNYSDGKEFNCSFILDKLIRSFHDNDSIGKYIGNILYTISSENLSFLDVPLYICGNPSSTYSGFSEDPNIVFIIHPDDKSISDSISLKQFSNLTDMYHSGQLHYSDDSGNIQPAYYFNTGHTFKLAADILHSESDSAAEYYCHLFNDWMKNHHDGYSSLNNTGSPVK